MLPKRKRQAGYALLSTAVIGLFAMTFLLSMGGILVSIARSEGVQKQKMKLQDSAEGALDFTLNYLNQNHPANSVYPISLTVPSAESASSVATVTKVRISNLNSTGVDWTTINKFSVLNSMVSTATPPSPYMAINSEPEFKLIEITITRGVFQKNVRVIVEPQISAPFGGDSLSPSGTVTQPLFTKPLVVRNTLNLLAGETISSLEPANKLEIQGEIVKGDSDSKPTVDGDVYTNRSQTDVRNEVDFSDYFPADSASSTNLAPIPQVSSSMPMPAYTDETVVLPPTSYQTNSLDSSTVNSFQLNNSTAAPPTKIFFDSTTPSLEINSNAFKNVDSVSPTNFQIYYPGSGELTINTNNRTFNGLIYAPNATVTVKGDRAFNGGIVADNVNANSAMNLMPSLSQTSSGSAAAIRNINSGLTVLAKNNELFFQGYKPVTWQEVNQKLVP